MKGYQDLELNILYCLLVKPKLMEQIKLQDKHFIKCQRMWQFMKAFYNKYKTFDMHLMATVASDKRQVIEYTSLLILDGECDENNFELYEQRLIEMYEETQKETWAIKKIYEIANELLVRDINIRTFNEKLKKIYEDANKIWKEGLK
jgi:hypothetical protein